MLSGIDVERSGSVISGLRHEEEGQDELEDEGTAHGMHDHAPVTGLHDRTSYRMVRQNQKPRSRGKKLTDRSGQVNASEDTKIEDGRAITTLMDEPDIGDRSRNQSLHGSHAKTLKDTGSNK